MQLSLICPERLGTRLLSRLHNCGHDGSWLNPDCLFQDETPESDPPPLDLLRDFLAPLPAPRIVWVMVPAGEQANHLWSLLMEVLEREDILLDGNGMCPADPIDSVRLLQEQGIHYVNIGTSDGVWGVTPNSYLVTQGRPRILRYLEPVFTAFAAPGLTLVPVLTQHFTRSLVELRWIQEHSRGATVAQVRAIGDRWPMAIPLR